MDHSNCRGRFITEFGCGCGKKVAGAAGANMVATRRVTVYEVQVNGSAVDEFDSLPEARTKAVELGGRVKVSSKVVTA